MRRKERTYPGQLNGDGREHGAIKITDNNPEIENLKKVTVMPKEDLSRRIPQ